MLRLIGLSENLKNTLILCSTSKKVPQSYQELKSAYQAFLKTIQPAITVPASKSIYFNLEPTTDLELAGLFQSRSHLNDKQQEDIIDLNDKNIQVENNKVALNEALEKSQKLDPDFYNLFNLVINQIFFAPSRRAGGGSSSTAIGVIWANHRPSWSQSDLIEFLAHEMTHTLMFLDERRYQHYCKVDILKQPEYFARSSILNISRPLDKVIHSLVVATEILCLRDEILGHPAAPKLHPVSSKMLQSCEQTLVSLQPFLIRDDVLTLRGRQLVRLCQERLYAI